MQIIGVESSLDPVLGIIIKCKCSNLAFSCIFIVSLYKRHVKQTIIVTAVPSLPCTVDVVSGLVACPSRGVVLLPLLSLSLGKFSRAISCFALCLKVGSHRNDLQHLDRASAAQASPVYVISILHDNLHRPDT